MELIGSAHTAERIVGLVRPALTFGGPRTVFAYLLNLVGILAPLPDHESLARQECGVLPRMVIFVIVKSRRKIGDAQIIDIGKCAGRKQGENGQRQHFLFHNSSPAFEAPDLAEFFAFRF
jgi:hypothetical protein